MITKEDALLRPHTILEILGNPADKPRKWRVNGKCKTWKRDPDRWELPVKYGLKAYGTITNENAHQFCLPERYEVEKHYAK